MATYIPGLSDGRLDTNINRAELAVPSAIIQAKVYTSKSMASYFARGILNGPSWY